MNALSAKRNLRRYIPRLLGPRNNQRKSSLLAKAQNNLKQIKKQVGTKAHQFIIETPDAAKQALLATGRELAKVDIPAVVVRVDVTNYGD